MADKPIRRVGSAKKPSPPAAPAAPVPPPPPTSLPAGFPAELPEGVINFLGQSGVDPASLGGVVGPAPQGPEFIPAGTVYTDFELEGLKKLNVDPKKPVPTDIAQQIAAHQRALEGPVPYHPDVKMDHVLKAPLPVDISKAPPDKVRSAAEAIDAFAKIMRPGANPVDPSPRAASAPSPQPRPQQGVVEFVDDLSPGGRTTAPPQPPAQPAYTPSPTAAGSALPPRVASPPEGAGGLLHPVECPHCGFDLKKQDDTPITDLDKLNFVQSVLGGQRFRQERLLFGGQLKLVFRSLTSREVDMAFRQIVVDAQSDLKNRLVNDTPFYWRNLMTYRMIMSIEKIESDVNGTIEVPPIEEIESDPPKFPDTKLVEVFDAVIEQVCPTEQLRSIIGHAYNEFQAVCDKLQVMAENPDFWKAIG
jgi:hypothetical protein